MPSDHDEDQNLTGIEAVLRHFSEVRKDTANLILVLEEKRNRKKKEPPPGAVSGPGSDV
jgi:hypothetical protein